MTTLERAQHVQHLIANGNYDEALDTYYADDVVVVEANGDTFTGRETQRQRVRDFMATVEEVHGGALHSVCASDDGRTSTAHTTFDATYAGMGRTALEEVAVHTWDGDRIVREQFFYWVPAEAQAAMGG